MKKIHKYRLDSVDEQIISMPQGAEILDVQVQRGEPYIWAIVHTDRPLRPYRFLMAGTGQELKPYLSYDHYVKTFQAGPFVGHIFRDDEYAGN